MSPVPVTEAVAALQPSGGECWQKLPAAGRSSSQHPLTHPFCGAFQASLDIILISQEKKRACNINSYEVYVHTLCTAEWKCFFLRKGGKLSTLQILVHRETPAPLPEMFPRIRREDTLLHCPPASQPSVQRLQAGTAWPAAQARLLSHMLNFHPLPRVIKLISGKDLIAFPLISIFFLTHSQSELSDPFQSRSCFNLNMNLALCQA